MQALRIVALCVVAAVIYGVVHDLVTVRVCLEYFTIGHPPVFATDSPTLLAIGWGIIATWWAGLILGALLALVARVGSWPKRTAREIVRPVGILLIVMAVAAAVAGACGYYLAEREMVWLVGDLAEKVARERHALFLADGFAHGASYVVGFGGGVALAVIILLRRRHAARQKSSNAPAIPSSAATAPADTSLG